MPEWIVYSRPGCGLCEEFIAQLADWLDPKLSASVQVVSIESNPELQRRYSDRIPVLTIDGDFVCAYRLDKERLRGYLMK